MKTPAIELRAVARADVSGVASRSSTSEGEKKSAALQKLFRDLPLCATATGTIPYCELIPGIADQLLLMRPGPSRRKFDVWADGTNQRVSPNAKKIAGAKRGLHMLVQSARRTVAALDGLSPRAIDALSAMVRPEALRRMRMALLAVQAVPEGKGKTGRLEQAGPSQATKIARAVADHYHGLTSKTPTAHDQRFLELLSAVYVVLGVKASARSQAMSLPKRAPENPAKNS
jgi:hypothetical protein